MKTIPKTKTYKLGPSEKVLVNYNQAKLIESLGFTAYWGANSSILKDGGFVQWIKEVNGIKIYFITCPMDEPDITNIVTLIVKRTIYHTQKVMKDKINKIDLFELIK